MQEHMGLSEQGFVKTMGKFISQSPSLDCLESVAKQESRENNPDNLQHISPQ